VTVGARGFLLLDALLAAALTTLVAAMTFGTLAAAFNEACRADRRLAAEGLAAEALATERTRSRHAWNPHGEPLEPGVVRRTALAGNRRFSLTLQKEVIPSCPGLFILSAQTVPLDGAGRPLATEAAGLSVMGHDPW
jgi:type II secretory pathway pseudopilin PulG